MLQTQTIQTREIVHNFYKALSYRELETLAQLFAESIDWDIPGNEELAPWLGKRTKRNEVKEFFKLLWQSVEPISAQIEHILVEDDFAIATGHFSSKMNRSGQIFSSMFSAHFTVRDSLIVRYRLQEDSHGLVEALMLPIPLSLSVL
ncbi:nuclear transport factor 2 family protein [Pedobacter hiemivivus]|uniref:Nuclear transport factor 2 family protein n=1 Tax=Pedobacter hiemivivus TaxID=2530454 RepID=A0A4R0NAA4_9SPHI|nr:nuclear transport factor 2 family protein [Pedobacter hiemivivus]TCC97178.1 nuclear transport factor 2 family protein [Pedobacter hiemivivus]